MKQTFLELIAYLKNPELGEDKNTNLNYRFTKFCHLLLISLATGILLMPIFMLIENIGWIDMENHAMEELMKNTSKLVVFFIVVLIAPIIEELIFRAPITLFNKPSSFKIAFYSFTILFGLIHITNFDITTNVLLLAPLLILPQILLGGYLGYIRVKFGLVWSMLLHASYNGLLMLMTFSSDL